VTTEEIGKAIQEIGVALHQNEIALAELRAAVLAVQISLALLMDREHPDAALKRVQSLAERLAKADPGAARRETISEAIELLKVLDEHGPPKDA
jgi:hypothetical protein